MPKKRSRGAGVVTTKIRPQLCKTDPHHRRTRAPMRPAIKQRIRSSHMPPCHRHMVFATNFSSMFDLLLCSTPQAWAECCLELTAVSAYRMFLGPFG